MWRNRWEGWTSRVTAGTCFGFGILLTVTLGPPVIGAIVGHALILAVFALAGRLVWARPRAAR